MDTKIQLTNAIRDELADWIRTGMAASPAEINAGSCSNFVSDVYNRLGGIMTAYALGLAEVGVDQFMKPEEEPYGFDLPLLTKHWPDCAPPSGMDWGDMDALASYADFDSGTHEWITLHGLHFDCECPQGVANFFDLPFFQRIIAGWKTRENTGHASAHQLGNSR